MRSPLRIVLLSCVLSVLAIHICFGWSWTAASLPERIRPQHMLQDFFKHEDTVSEAEPFSPSATSTIEGYIKQSAEIWKHTVGKASKTLGEAAAAYRVRHGRHPPPGFDLWFEHAQKKDAVIVEDFFDQISKDIEPLFGLTPSYIHQSAAAYSELIQIRDGQANYSPGMDEDTAPGRIKEWRSMMEQFVKVLPDMDIPLNHWDEPRVLAPKTKVDELMSEAGQQKQRSMQLPLHLLVGDIHNSSSIKPKLNATLKEMTWQRTANGLHQAIRDSCPPESDLAKLAWPWVSEANQYLDKVNKVGFVSTNLTRSKDICDNPAFARQHAALVRPATVLVTTDFIPMFSASKLPQFNDIVIPDPIYWHIEPSHNGIDELGDWSQHFGWDEKHDQIIWRGSGTGGWSDDDNYRFFHRHRFVSAVNSTEVASVVAPANTTEDYIEWIKQISDVEFTALFCVGDTSRIEFCPNLTDHYRTSGRLRMGGQYEYKYLPDLDGNSISERFRAFLLSNSAPIKSTIFDDWHDSRLQPWQHYIPLSVSYFEIYDILRYFLGYKKQIKAHDRAGQKIADDGREWALKVMRREDMELYLYRALLEFARVANDNRDHLGYVDDLLQYDDQH